MRIKKISQVAGVIASVMNSFKESETDTYSCNYINDLTKIKGEDLPIGSIVRFGGSTIPTGWLLCDGSAVSRTTYSELFAAIGVNYGAGDNSTTFNLPNSKGKVGVGLDTEDTDFNTIGKTGGEKIHTLTIKEMPQHRHGFYYGNAGDGSDWAIGLNWDSSAGNRSDGGVGQGIDYSGESNPHNNLQPYETYNYIIKAFQNAIVSTFAGPCASFSKTNNQVLTETQYDQILFNTSDYIDANTFELQEDGTIKVLKNISRIQINCNIRVSVKNDILYLKCYSDSDTQGCLVGRCVEFTNKNDITLNLSGVLKVKKGDFIHLILYSYNGSANVFGYDKNYCGINLAVLESSENFSDELIVQEKTLSDTNVYSANYVNKLAGEVLWTNPNGYAVQEFSSQTLTFEDNYDHYDIIYAQDGISLKCDRVYVNANVAYILQSNLGGYIRTRGVAAYGSSILFDNGYFYATYATGEINNNQCVPYKIIGYK